MSSTRWGKLLYFSLMAMAFAGFVVLLGRDVRKWSDLSPVVRIERGSWRILADAEGLGCEAGVLRGPASEAAEPRCPAAADFQGWEAAPVLDRARPLTNPFWLRTRIDGEALARAAAAGAHHLALGKFVAGVKLWVNGQPIQELDTQSRSVNIVPLPVGLLSAAPALDITLRVEPREGTRRPLIFMAELSEGLHVKEVAGNVRSYLDFIDKTKAFALFFAYALLSAAFFFLWVSNPVAKEYLALALLAFVNCLPELIFGETFSFQVPRDVNFKVIFALMAMKAVAVLYLGLSFARVRLPGVYYLSAAAGAVAAIVFGIENDALIGYRAFLLQGVLPASFAVGAIACFWQIHTLYSDKHLGAVPGHRVRALRHFGVVAVGLLLFQYAQFAAWFPNFWSQLLWGVGDFGFVAVIGLRAVADFRRRGRLIERSPVSEYHKRTHQSQAVEGLLVVLDIKNSEDLFRSEDAPGDGPVLLLIEKAWRAFAAEGAIVLRAEGDELIAFFDFAKEAAPLPAVLRACTSVAQEFRVFADGESVTFRAAVTAGKIQPRWIGMGSARYPTWQQVGETKVFVDASRMLEIERSAPGDADACRVVLPGELTTVARAALPAGGKLVVVDESFTAKHGRAYRVSVVETAA